MKTGATSTLHPRVSQRRAPGGVLVDINYSRMTNWFPLKGGTFVLSSLAGLATLKMHKLPRSGFIGDKDSRVRGRRISLVNG